MSAGGRRAWTAVGLAVAAGLAAGPAHASVDSVVAAGPDGGAHFAWTEEASPGVVQTRRLTAAGALGAKQPMSPAASQDQDVGVDAAGNTVIAWLARSGDAQVVQVRRRTAAGALSTPQTLSAAGVYAIDVAMDVEPDGDAIVVWNRPLNGKYVIQARRRSATGTLSPVYTLSYAGAHSTDADVEITPGGAATVAWTRKVSNSPPASYVQTRTVQPDGTLSETQGLSSTSTLATPPRVTVSDAGVATIAWVRSVNGLGTAYYRVRAADGTLGAPVAFASNVAFAALTAAGNGAGRTAFAWLENDGGVHDTKARTREAGGALNPVFDVGAGNQGYRPTVAVDPQGNTTFAWSESAGGSRANHVRRRTVSGFWGPLRVVSSATADAGPPHLAVDAGGKATVAWYEDATTALYARTVTPGGTMSPAPLQVDGP